MSPDVLVIGGGVSGLTSAVALANKGLDVMVLEADAVAGGNVRTSAADGFRFERGPHTFMGSADDVFDLAETAGITAEVVPTDPKANDRFIVRGGRMHTAPSGAISFLGTRLLSLSAKLTLATEPLRSAHQHPDDTAAVFFRRRFGREAGRVLAGAFINGVYAGDPATLSARAAFPLFWGFERDHGSMVLGSFKYQRERARKRGDRPRRTGLYSFAGGLGRLSEALAGKLGERCLTGREVLAVRRENGAFVVRASDGEVRARNVIVATPPLQSAALLGSLDPEAGKLVAATPMAPVAVVHLGFRAGFPAVPDGFGFLAPRGEGVRVLGILFASRLFGDRAPAGGDLLTGFVGGVLDREAMDLPDEELTGIVLGDLARLIAPPPRPDFVVVTRYPQAIPQLVVGHAERMEALKGRLAAVPGLVLAGNYLRGVGLKDAVASGLQAAKAVLAREQEGRAS
jgi:protoporphyrinogen/coproporphyrinogen III oxidase